MYFTSKMLSQQPITYPNVGAPLGGLPQAGVGQVGQFPPQPGMAPGMLPPQQQYVAPPVAPVPAPAAPATTQSKISNDLDEIFGLAPTVPAAAPAAPLPTAGFQPTDVAGQLPLAAPAPFQQTPGFGVPPQALQPQPGLGIQQPVAQPGFNMSAPPAAPTPGMLPQVPQPAPISAPVAGLPTPSPLGGLPAPTGLAPAGVGMGMVPQPGIGAATTLPGGHFGTATSLQPTGDLSAGMLGLSVGGLTPGLQPTPALGTVGLTPGLGVGVGMPTGLDPSLMSLGAAAGGHDEISEVERKQRDSMKTIQKIKDEIMALKGQTETASMERRARDTAAQQAHTQAAAVAAAQPVIQNEHTRTQERDDENLARQLQAMEGAQPPRSSTTQYEGVGGVTQLEQEQRDLALAQEMQNQENKTRAAPAVPTRPAGGYSSSQAPSYGNQPQSYSSPSPSYGGGNTYNSNSSGTSYEGVGGVSRLEQEQRDMALAQEMQDQENRKSSQREQRQGGAPSYGSQASQGGDGEGVRFQSVSVCDTQTLDSVTYYIVQVTMTNGTSRKLQKRYSVFDTLHQKFTAGGYPGSNFPPKSMFKKTGQQAIELRRTQLNMWLSDLVEKVCIKIFY